MTDAQVLKDAMRRVNTAAKSRWHVAREQDWRIVLNAHPDKPALDAVAAWYPLETEQRR